MDKKELKNKANELRKNWSHDAAADLYREYLKGATTQEERIKRIHEFRCGGNI